MKKRGISLITLVITIIVITVIASAIILTLNNSGILDKSKKARFMNDFREVESGVNLYSLSRYNANTSEFDLPLKGYLTVEDKTYIKNNVPTLNVKITELSGSIDTANLAWISSTDIGAKLSSVKQEKGYILDVTTGQIYDYIGDVFEGKRWHTLDDGVVIGQTTPKQIVQELWDGWINLTLYYPASSTDKKWRLGTEGELRLDPMLMWQDYTGPIKIPLDRVKDVWIKYIIDGKEVIIPPAGTLLVDIVPDKTGAINVAQVSEDTNAYASSITQVKVNINYDEGATTKEYRVGNSGWITYKGEFIVTENCVIEARAKKLETIYNTDGTVLTTRNVLGKDIVYIGNITVEETQLEAPIITRLDPVGSEKARVQVAYPAGATKKIYKVNYGVEENYTDIINVNNYGTYIIAYYYDASGKRSQASSIYINDTSGGETGQPPKPYDPNPPYIAGGPPPVTPPNDVPAPTVNVSPSSLVEEVQVSIASPANADKVYIKLGRYAQYQEYTLPITVRENMEVYAYYRTYTGEISNTGYGVVNNIKKNNKPYVYISANPYPWSGSYGASSVVVTINYSDTTSIEYSEDGIVYQPYTAPFNVTKNETIYARGTNGNGVTETSLNITNIGKLNAPIPITNLAVNISVNPEPSLSTSRVAKATVTIDYDAKATEKYYTIGRYGSLQTYTGPFDVTSSCTIYAYAKGLNAKGYTSKSIDNVSNGISEPNIIAIPSNGTDASKVTVTILYDKYSTIKRYSIDGGSLRDYTGVFEVTKNGSVIYAYSENDVGQKSESSYKIENIVPDPPMLLLDKGDYYLLKLNYPPGSKGQEYKWKTDGTWVSYKEAGILLIKPQFKDKVIKNGTLVKIEDENGNMVTFTGDYYLIDVPISELFENLSMRWDRVAAEAPQIILNTTNPAKQVLATITYSSTLIKKEYKIIKPGEVSSDWIDYTGPITIDQNNTVIYAKGMDETEVWSLQAMKKITNIDEVQPVIKLTADLSLAQQKVPVKVNVTDDVAVGIVKWAPGLQGESYFKSGGNEITNDSIVNITNNGYYTFYAEDQVGNTQVYTLNVTNVDLTAPLIDISVSPETTVGLTSNITINYGDATLKQYKVGTSNVTWINYTSSFDISSYTVLSNNWQNSDGTVTIYAKGKDSAGNEITVQKKVVSLDLDRPFAPVINSRAGYPLMTSYGITYDGTTTITYDSRTDIDNYYSIDNGVTWLVYTGQFNVTSGTVIAKSVKKSTKLEVSISKTISMPADALNVATYDGNDTTSIAGAVAGQYMALDSNMINKNIRIKWFAQYGYSSAPSTVKLQFLDDNKNEISNLTRTLGSYDEIYKIPLNTKWIVYSGYNGYQGTPYLYEIQPSNEPTFTATNGYMTLTADVAKAIKDPYQMVTINYFPTSVQRLYKIGSTGEWLNYNDQPVKVIQGLTIYAKGIDGYGNATRIVSSYTSNSTDALRSQAYDGNDSTYIAGQIEGQYMEVDSNMIGKNIRVKWFAQYGYSSAPSTVKLQFLDSNKIEISNVTRTLGLYDEIYKIPANTKWIVYSGYNGYQGTPYLYEIGPSNEPTLSGINGYMLLHADLSKAIRDPYQMVTINYFPTSVQRLYKIGSTGEWLNYNDQAVKVIQGVTIYAKGIDQYGNETRIISSYTSNSTDALKKEAWDENDSTYVGELQNQYMEVDSSMYNRNIRVRWNCYTPYSTPVAVELKFLDSNKNVLDTVRRAVHGLYDEIYIVPQGTKWIVYTGSPGWGGAPYLYEIQPSNSPAFVDGKLNNQNKYILLTTSLAVTINYYPTSVQRLYRIGTTGSWMTYNDQPIQVSGIIYAKGIDQNGIESVISMYNNATASNAIGNAAYDGDSNTSTSMLSKLILVDSSVYNKNVRIKLDAVVWANINIQFLDENNQIIDSFNIANGLFTVDHLVPVGTKYITGVYTNGTSSTGNLYEISVVK